MESTEERNRQNEICRTLYKAEILLNGGIQTNPQYLRGIFANKIRTLGIEGVTVDEMMDLYIDVAEELMMELKQDRHQRAQEASVAYAAKRLDESPADSQ